MKNGGIVNRDSLRIMRMPAATASMLLVFFMMLTTPVLAYAPQESRNLLGSKTLAIVRARGATMHESPGGEVLETLPRGTVLWAIGRSEDASWVSVVVPDGLSGWVQTDELVVFAVEYLPVTSDYAAGFSGGVDAQSPDDPTVTSSTSEAVSSGADKLSMDATVTTASQRLNVRSGPGTGYPVIGRLAPSEAVAALGRNVDADWIQVALQDDGFGWASAAFLEVDGEVDALPVSDVVSAAEPLPIAAATSARSTGLTGKLVFQDRSGGKIYSYDLGSDSLRPLTDGADPAISPDGRTVAFWRGGGQHTLHLIDIDGNNERQMLTRAEPLRGPTWSPDGQSIAFSRVNGEGACRDAGHGICLPDQFPYNLLFPLKTMDLWGVSRVDRDGGNFRDLPTLNSAMAADWGDAGVLYHSGTGIQLTGDYNGAENQAILNEFRFQDPAWQPGGNRLAFQSQEKDHWEIFTATADGQNVVALTRPATTLVDALPHNVAPAWSPDGQSIVFLSNRSGDWAIWVMNADGSNQRQLSIDVPIQYGFVADQPISWGR
ncbi:MAG: SH3 domain-containing protein [Chloroflexota bacterium]|nr:SH3 domain-containing protein [Chloroflexota bacterium]